MSVGCNALHNERKLLCGVVTAVGDDQTMRDEDPTPAEAAFFTALQQRVRAVQDWYYRDAEGLWMIASLDLPLGHGHIRDTWRCDFDGVTLLAGRSPGYLNWDDGVRALAAGVDVDGPNGLRTSVTDPASAALEAASWFESRVSAE